VYKAVKELAKSWDKTTKALRDVEDYKAYSKK
jgi:hypothetical protein